jgi:hypothetical protein
MTDKIIEALSNFLQYGPTGLGLAIAVIAGIVLVSGRLNSARTKAAASIMIFGFAVFTLGIGAEFYKTYLENAKYQQAFAFYSQLPDQLWEDYLKAKTAEVFKGDAPMGVNDVSSVKAGGQKTFALPLKINQCLGYYAATPPPSGVQVDVNREVQHVALVTKDYFKSGQICSVIKSSDSSAAVVVTVEGLEGARSQLTFATFALPSVETQQPVRTSKVAGIVCTGEMEGSCTGPHALFVPCGASVDNAIRARFCEQYTLRSLSSVSGNRCGYGLIEVSCVTD